LTVYRLHIESGVAESRIGRFLNTDKQLRSDNLSALLDALGVEVRRKNQSHVTHPISKIDWQRLAARGEHHVQKFRASLPSKRTRACPEGAVLEQ